MKRVLFICSFLVVFVLQAQTPIKHVVQKGETVYQIAKKYQITPFDIYRLNPDAKNGLQENDVLVISKELTTNLKSVEEKVITHIVAPKETLYSLAKKYEVSVSDIKEWNPDIEKNGLKIGQEIIVSKQEIENESGYVVEEETSTKTETFSYKVLPQDTKYGISKKFDITIDELEKSNPQIKEELREGEVLIIKKQHTKKQTKVNNDANFYTVKQKETLYSLCKELNVSQDELLLLNPHISEGLKEGMILKLPSKGVKQNVASTNMSFTDLYKKAKKDKTKNLVLLLPFGLNRMEADSTKNQLDYLKTNKFLNMTVDFYAGVMMAIDSAKVLGLPVNIKIYDVESTKTTSNVASIIAKNNFSNVDAVIGPFQNTHVETTAQLLSKYNTPVISPISKEIGKSLTNIYYSVPTQQNTTKLLFEHFEKSNNNVIGIISPKKNASKEFLTSHYSKVKYPKFNEKGGLDYDDLKSLFEKNRKNYVILDSENRSFVLNVTNNLIKLKKEFDIQLVVLELYDTLDFEEIPITNLTELNMIFPSNKREINTVEGYIFEKKYKKVNGIAPNSIVIKGFDVTFDTILRICQEEGFSSSIAKYKTEYVENNFDYVIDNGTNVNVGGYLLYYDNDLTIKQLE